MSQPIFRAKILYDVSLGLSTPRSALNCLSSSSANVSRVLSKFEEEGLVRMRTFTVKKRGRKLIRKYYVITKKGVEKLLTDYLEFYPWLSNFEVECATRFPLTGGAVIKPERRNRLMKMALATVMMNEVVGPVAPVPVEGKVPSEKGEFHNGRGNVEFPAQSREFDKMSAHGYRPFYVGGNRPRLSVKHGSKTGYSAGRTTDSAALSRRKPSRSIRVTASTEREAAASIRAKGSRS